MNNKSTFRELLLHPDKKKNEAENELAWLFRDMMGLHGMLPSQWDARLDNYYRRQFTNQHGHVDLIKVNQEKSNLVRALTKNTIPWRRYMTSLMLMGPTSIHIEVKLEYADGKTFSNKLKIRNRVSDIATREATSETNKELDPDEEDGHDSE